MSGARSTQAARTPSGPIARANSVAIEALEKLGLRWVLDAVVTAGAVGVVVGDYGARVVGQQVTLLVDARRVLLRAEPQLPVSSSGVRAEIFEILRWLADAMSARIVDLNRFLALATKDDFDEIAGRLDAIDGRIGGLERARKSSRRAPARAKHAKHANHANPATPAKPVARSPKRTSHPKAAAAKATVEKAAAAKAAVEKAAAAKAAVQKTAAPQAATVDHSSTMFIGSMPSGGPGSRPPERASSMSNEPDAMSAYLAKNRSSSDADDVRGRRRRQKPDGADV